MSNFNSMAREILAINEKHSGYAVCSEQLDSSCQGQDLAQTQLEKIGWKYRMDEDCAWWIPPECDEADPRAFGFDAAYYYKVICDDLLEPVLNAGSSQADVLREFLEDHRPHLSALHWLANQAPPYKPLEP